MEDKSSLLALSRYFVSSINVENFLSSINAENFRSSAIAWKFWNFEI